MDETLKAKLRETFAALAEVFPFIRGDVERLIDLYREKAIFEPTTVRETLEQWSRERIVSDEFRASLLAAADRLSPPTEQDFPWSRPGNDLFEWMRARKLVLGVATFSDQIRPTLTTDVRFVFRAQMFEALQQPSNTPFERRVRVLADVCRASAEGWYKPILQCLLLLSGAAPNPIPAELGPLLTSCARVSIPASILRDPIRIVRNSVAHGQAEFRLQEETVAFMSVSRSGKRDVVGPLTWDEFVAFADSCLNHFWTLTLVLRRHLRLAENSAEPTE